MKRPWGLKIPDLTIISAVLDDQLGQQPCFPLLPANIPRGAFGNKCRPYFQHLDPVASPLFFLTSALPFGTVRLFRQYFHYSCPSLSENSVNSMTDNHIPRINGEFKLERFDNEVLLYSVVDATAVYLNETALLVYGMCASGQSIGEIVSLLEEAYPEQKETIRHDVLAALEQLVDNGAVLLDEHR
jgi:Coenzyme PQQ synthesis protein D (PqqD)